VFDISELNQSNIKVPLIKMYCDKELYASLSNGEAITISVWQPWLQPLTGKLVSCIKSIKCK
jgi:hypothetical protein